MATIASTSSVTRNSLLRSIAIGGIIIGIVQVIHQWLVFTVFGETPFTAIFQYIASGVLGVSAFEGGITTTLLGILLHFVISFVIAGVFILSAERIPFLRRYPIPSALLYGFGVWIVMNLIVTPLSAAPPVPMPSMPRLIELILDHILVIGLTVGMLVQRNTNPNQ